MKNKNKTTTRIKLSKAKRNNKNIFGVLGFEKINNANRNKQEKTKHEYTENWHEANVELSGLSVYAYLPPSLGFWPNWETIIPMGATLKRRTRLMKRILPDQDSMTHHYSMGRRRLPVVKLWAAQGATAPPSVRSDPLANMIECHCEYWTNRVAVEELPTPPR